MNRTVAAIALWVALGCQAAQPGRLTEKCNTLPISSLDLVVTATFMEDFARVSATDLERGADLYRRLWEPQTMFQYEVAGTSFLRLDYDPSQDIAQIALEIEADPVLLSHGAGTVQLSPQLCFPGPGGTELGSSSVVIAEYRNRILDHYFLSSSLVESQAIDKGLAGPGWEKTFERFSTRMPFSCRASTHVFRFYSPLAHSHLFTADPQECGDVRKSNTGWVYEGFAFRAYLPVNGECPAPMRPVVRMYNRRAAQNDSNYRYVSRLALVPEMVGRGWAVEGVAFCVDQ